ncbi:GCN5 family acetyltransferase [Nesterenkonia sp. AN1]|uniref:ElaA protein n=1 Tax=Nesterenkonia aurantiaca TaxID=1436010 RepID=A0A4R7FYK8_9MICC|nr:MULTISPECIES: GNAT family N-acetyltransferase [Nesterenkonia]EXF26277.1 GCN5 family acetyltransferase [Nesterenkonia sp. AN1]TDS83807.1 ElaA protein [Nesterenkonia aurantiaca]
MPASFHAAPVAQMDPITLYRILQLRTDVFVVEQQCPYPELDGRDLEPGAVMLWAIGDTPGEQGADDDGAPTATLRVLREPEGFRIGRVVASPAVRGTGVAGELMRRALELCSAQSAESSVTLDAQAPLQGWYESFGFARSGAPFLEDGIPHVPMRRD